MLHFFRRKKNLRDAVDFDEVLLDATNVSSFDEGRLEGRFELPITARSIYIVGICFMLVAIGFGYAVFSLQVLEGSEYRRISEANVLDRGTIIAERGVVYDRNEELLVWNEFDPSNEYDFATRSYTDNTGLGPLLGYVSYPQTDAQGIFWRTEYEGRNGIEGIHNDRLSGTNGEQIVEVDALQNVVGEHVLNAPESGEPVYLTIDGELSQALHEIIATSSRSAGFRSGAGVIMDVDSGEIIAMTSYPSYDPQIMADGELAERIASWSNDERSPFLNKVVGGVYTPGSIVKPFVSYAALAEEVVEPEQTMYSDGALRIPNPYNPEQPARFTDWRAHGEMNLREAIAFSSNIYMYIIAGGLPSSAVPQAGLDEPFTGLGISNLAEQLRRFGLGTSTGINLDHEQAGVVPDPAWKKQTFDDEWRLGDTYLTAIGQFGFQVTPLQMVRAYAAIANGGKLHVPRVVAHTPAKTTSIQLDTDALTVVREGMRMAVNYRGGTARSLEREDVAIAAKSGTAEVGRGNSFVNSWAAGYFPYKEPRYAFVLLMERAPRDNTLGATTVMGDVIEWMASSTPRYLGIPKN
jgi:penicillin-binding protein 2